MPRDTNDIERDIERAREELASTLDTLAVRANPQRLVGEAKATALATMTKPAVLYPLIGIGALIAAVMIRKIVS